MKLIAGYKFYEDNVYWHVDSANFDIENVNTSNEAYIRNSLAIHGPRGSVIRRINSFMGNFIYNYNQKYFISIAANNENLKEGVYANYTELFPSVALSWDLAQETWVNELGWINHFNLYVNWGRTGNYPLNGLSDDLYGKAYHVVNNNIDSGLFIRQLSNHRMKPELVEERDFGTRIDLFKNSRIMVGADLYYKTNSDLIVQRVIPDYYGGGKMYYNVGIIENHGKELSIEAIPILTQHFIWYSKFNFSTNNQMVKKLSDNQPINFPSSDILFPAFSVNANEKLGSIMGYKILGKWTSKDQAERDNAVGVHHLKYVKVDGFKVLNNDTTNNLINIYDKVVLGSSIPAYTWNWYNSFSYKGFSVDFLWYAVMGVSKYNATRAATYTAATNRETNNIINDSLPILRNGIFYQSSYFVEDASFLRLKQLTFSYQPQKKFFNNVNMKFSLSFENLITITKYKGYDPEASIYTDNNFSDNAVDRGAFPNPKAVYFSITLKF
jgi:hypothetical protein